jgi:hypothetical protein
MHADEPLIHEHGFLMVKIATDEFEILYINCQILAKFQQNKSKQEVKYVLRYTNSIWNMEELPQH